MRRGCVNVIVVLLLVILVVALLWTRFVWPEAKKQGTSQTIYVIEEALEVFHEDEGKYPSGENSDLVLALIDAENAAETQYIDPKTVVVENGEFVDFWKTPLRFELTDQGKPKITSAGADLEFDTADDVTSERVRRSLKEDSPTT